MGSNGTENATEEFVGVLADADEIGSVGDDVVEFEGVEEGLDEHVLSHSAGCERSQRHVVALLAELARLGQTPVHVIVVAMHEHVLPSLLIPRSAPMLFAHVQQVVHSDHVRLQKLVTILLYLVIMLHSAIKHILYIVLHYY